MLYPNIPMALWAVRRILAGRALEVVAHASAEWTLCGEEPFVRRPALFLDGALEKIKAVSPWRSASFEMKSVHGEPGVHHPTKAFLLRNVQIAGPFIYVKGSKMRPGFGKNGALVRATTIHRFKEAHLVSCSTGTEFFGCYLMDEFPLMLIDPDYEFNIASVSNHYGHGPGYRELVQIADAPVVSYGFVDALTIYSDHAQNSLKEKRYRMLRDRVSARLRSQAPAAGVFLKRGVTGERRVLRNEPEIEAIVREYGFDVVDPSQLTSFEIARRTFGAKVVVGVEGSHLSHAIYSMADDAAFLVIQPPNRFSMSYKDFADGMGMPFAFVVGDEVDDGFVVAADELRATLDKVLRVVR
jgi:hypothetical protein